MDTNRIVRILRSDVPIVKPPPHGRNSPCLCGSGKKYKRCCLVVATEAAANEFRLGRLQHETRSLGVVAQ